MKIEPFLIDSPGFGEAVRIYVDTWRRPLDDSNNFIAHYARSPGFHGLLAHQGEVVVGMGFGANARPGDWWYDCVAMRVGPEHPALQDAWVLVELAVHSRHRRRGIGGILHDALVRQTERPRALLSTGVSNEAAVRFYRHHGWRVLHPGFSFQANQAPYLVMARELPS